MHHLGHSKPPDGIQTVNAEQPAKQHQAYLREPNWEMVNGFPVHLPLLNVEMVGIPSSEIPSELGMQWELTEWGHSVSWEVTPRNHEVECASGMV